MNLFLCRADVTTREYRSSVSRTDDVIRLVQAETEEQAREKFETNYTSQSYEYGTQYEVGYVDVSDIIT